MAREDLITKYIALVNQKQNIPPMDDNQPLQFVTAPNDTMTAAFSVIGSSVMDPATFKWGPNATWKWGRGRWKSGPNG